jgi:hypothetical protein
VAPYGALGRYEEIVLPGMAKAAARCAVVIGVDRAGLKQALRDGNFFCAWQHENAASKLWNRCGNHE